MFGLMGELNSIVKKAGDAILKVYGEESYGVQIKADDSPVTLADIAANEVICEGLQKLDPGIPKNLLNRMDNLP